MWKGIDLFCSSMFALSVMEDKCAKYLYISQALRAINVLQLVMSVDGLLHREVEHFLKRMAANLAHKWEKPYSQTCGYVRARLAFAIIRATNLCNQFVSKGLTSEVEEWTWDG